MPTIPHLPQYLDFNVRRTATGYNEQGRRVGDGHPNALLTDRDVELIREMHASGVGYKRLAQMFEIGRSTARDIVKFRRRWQVATQWR